MIRPKRKLQQLGYRFGGIFIVTCSLYGDISTQKEIVSYSSDCTLSPLVTVCN